MALYKTKFCKVGYNPEITTSTDPEDVCTGLGLNGDGTYVFPTKVPKILDSESVYTRTYFITSSSSLDTGYHTFIDKTLDPFNEDDTILIDENMHGSVGAIEVKVIGLNTRFGLTEERILLNGQTPVKLNNHYHRINELKVITTGRLLSNQGDIYITALDGVRSTSVPKLANYVSSGVPIATQNIYAKIAAGDNRMLSSHYTVPRSHTLYVEGIKLRTDVLSICNWKLMAGVNGSLHTIYKGVIPNSFEAQEGYNIAFKDGYAFPGGSDIIIRIDTVGGTTDISSVMEGYLISQVLLNLENQKRKALKDQVLAKPELASVVTVQQTKTEELEEERYIEDDYTDEEFYDVPDYQVSEEQQDVYESEVTEDLGAEEEIPPSDEEIYEEECEDGYFWCDVSRTCIGVDDECI